MRALENYSATSYSCWLFGNKFPMAPTALSAAFYSLHTAVGNCTMNKFVVCNSMAQWKFEAQNVVILCGQRRYDERWAILAKQCNERSAIMSVAMLRPLLMHQVLPIPARSSIMHYCTVYIFSIIACLWKLRGGGGGGWTSLFNSTCKHCSAVDNSTMNFMPALAICFQTTIQKTRRRSKL